MSSGLSVVTLWLPLTSHKVFKNPSLVSPKVAKTFVDGEEVPSESIARKICSTEMYSSLSFSASSPAFTINCESLCDTNILPASWPAPDTLGLFRRSISKAFLIFSTGSPILPISFGMRPFSWLISASARCSLSTSW